MDESEVEKREQEIARGNQAKVILDSELFQEAFDTLKSTYMNAWENSTLGDSQGRERIYAMVANLADVKAHFTTVLNTGKMAESQLDALNQGDDLVDKKKLFRWGVRV